MSKYISESYKKMLRGGVLRSLESLNEEANPPIAKHFVQLYEEQSRSDLHRIVKEYLENDKTLLNVADRIVDQGKNLDKLLSGSLDISNRDMVLEAIVRTDGSRPSFLIKNDDIDFNSSPVGEWNAAFLSIPAKVLKTAIQSVGRINLPGFGQGFKGTGFLIHDNLVVTNRHVLQQIAQVRNNTWEFFDNAHIDFGHEFRARKSVNPRKFTKVVFAAGEEIVEPIVHRKLDLAIIELEKLEAGKKVSKLALDVSTDWADPTTNVMVIGYPGNPGFTEATPPNLLEQLFATTFGYKRIAPGEIMNSLHSLPPTTTSYDNTTLGGNSGSCVVVFTRTHAAAALHYGGTSTNPRRNWGHIIGTILDRKDQFSQVTLGNLLTSYGVTLIDRN